MHWFLATWQPASTTQSLLKKIPKWIWIYLSLTVQSSLATPMCVWCNKCITIVTTDSPSHPFTYLSTGSLLCNQLQREKKRDIHALEMSHFEGATSNTLHESIDIHNIWLLGFLSLSFRVKQLCYVRLNLFTCVCNWVLTVEGVGQ